MNYYELLKKWGNVQPKKTLLTVDENSWSYGDMLALVHRLQQEFAAALPPSLQQGSILVEAKGTAAQLAAFLALQAVSIRPILLHHGLTPQEKTAILQENQLQGILTIRQNLTGQFDWSIRTTQNDHLVHTAKDIMGVLSSGSTGAPKVMYRTYASWAGFFPVQNEIFHIRQDSRLFFHGNLSFTGNLNAVLGVLYAGGSLITSQTFHCRQWEILLERNHADVVYLLPTKLQLLTASTKGSWPLVRSIFTGSQMMSHCHIQNVKAAFPQAELILYYGASELNYITYTICKGEKRDSRNLGRPFPGIGLSVRDGIIYVDTPYHVSGLAKPFTVRDTGWLNENGELIFTGRREAWINKGGVKISIQHLENELQEIAGIEQAAVIPCPDALRGNNIAAFLVRDTAIAESTIRREIRQNLKPVEIPEKITFLTQLPLNDRGKVDRRQLIAHCRQK